MRPLQLLVNLTLVATALAGTAFSQSVALADGFEGPTLNPFWTPTIQGGSITFPSTVEIHSGQQAIQLNSASGTYKNIALGHVFSQPSYGHVSIWLYDTAASAVSSNYFGFNASPFSVVTRDYNLGPSAGGNYEYQIYPNNPVTTSIARTVGWHHFQIYSTASAAGILIDGIQVYSAAGGTPFTQVSFAMFAPSWRPSVTSYWDDATVNVWPAAPAGQANSPCASLTVNGVGATGPGPFVVQAPAPGTLNLDWSGPANQPLALFATSRLLPGQRFGGYLVVDIDLGSSFLLFNGLHPYGGSLFFTGSTGGGYGSAAQSFSVPASAMGTQLNVQGVVFDSARLCAGGIGLTTTASFAIQL